ncbi:hypothetical protein DLM45_03015 [Hyphomicrobium methylovorum]|uniref:hypothetical protein n=1 Tax=Hyphomicrobium methylovorum TaxID=84 RepID=UPI0015E6EB7A|nr:hypothetical protein [Hyphomicrobium methylovorum]MBA2125195.1 hypothetical protein [Hyphomicrobium methylovorum]
MKCAKTFFVSIAAVGFLSASPCVAHPSVPTFASAQDRHAVITVGHRQYYDEYYDEDFIEPPPPRRRAFPTDDESLFLEVVPLPPANCGEFRYWNGEYCADARVQPPYVGPRW